MAPLHAAAFRRRLVRELAAVETAKNQLGSLFFVFW